MFYIRIFRKNNNILILFIDFEYHIILLLFKYYHILFKSFNGWKLNSTEAS